MYQYFRWTFGFHLQPKDEGNKLWNVGPIYQTTKSHPSNMRTSHLIFMSAAWNSPLNNRFYHCQWLPEGNCSHSRQWKMLLMTVTGLCFLIWSQIVVHSSDDISNYLCIIFACKAFNTYFIQLCQLCGKLDCFIWALCQNCIRAVQRHLSSLQKVSALFILAVIVMRETFCVLATVQLVVWCVISLMILTLFSVFELL